MRRAEPHAAAAGSTAAKQLRALIPPMTPGLILRVLFGVFLFFGGIVFGVWLIIRSRRLDGSGRSSSRAECRGKSPGRENFPTESRLSATRCSLPSAGSWRSPAEVPATL